ncbi:MULTISPECIES: glycosyltransferase [unclassified Leptolyngbya]|uniref:glycosyltransferase n=1 Tax=unclassified Leptolyngbya TaxID=2650499 RepID=UPI001689EF6A|nr:MULTISPECIES: glycosyltransferase [unclassified Leptolyngbya]MBD1911519.1 glycosyltransferase [Leptolyngbya sp. FACHB-8]MBD2155240.1 glycosyltransferase [Leptolyngbya sp. FACHB-16]
MRTLYFLLPGTGGKFACGGLWAELKTLKMAQKICPAEVVTYRQREKDTLFLDDVLQQPNLDNVIFVLSWGFDVPKLAARVRSHPTIYHAHSAGYGFQLPASVPIITVSRNTLGYWGQKAPNNLLYYLPNEISDSFQNLNQERDIDVLVQVRKSSRYLLNQLVPALQQVCNVYVVDHYIEDLPGLFNRAKVYLYDSAEYWALQGVSEGFGLQPLEAFACGCQVFSSLNGGLSDYLDPGFNCHKIAGYSLAFDTQRILRVLENFEPSKAPELFLEEYRTPNILQKLQLILQDINQFFDHQHRHASDIPSFTKTRLFKLSLEMMWQKIQKRYLHSR